MRMERARLLRNAVARRGLRRSQPRVASMPGAASTARSTQRPRAGSCLAGRAPGECAGARSDAPIAISAGMRAAAISPTNASVRWMLSAGTGRPCGAPRGVARKLAERRAQGRRWNQRVENARNRTCVIRCLHREGLTRVHRSNRTRNGRDALAASRPMTTTMIDQPLATCSSLAAESKNCSSSVEPFNAVVDDWLPCTVCVTASK